jgi:hypothetical protein
MLGPELETYTGNKLVIFFAALLAMGPAALLYFAFTTTPRDNAFRIIAAVLFALPAYYLAWLMSLRVTLHRDGITYHSLLSEKEMCWDRVERFGYEATRHSIHFIPIGTYYLFRLRDAEGNKIRIGNRIAHPAKLGEKLVELTTPGLLRKALDRYSTGQELDFGVIRVSRTNGVKVRKIFHYREIPWDQVSSFAIQQGRFYVWEVGKKRTVGWGLHHVFNAFALLGLLQSIMSPGNKATG